MGTGKLVNYYEQLGLSAASGSATHMEGPLVKRLLCEGVLWMEGSVIDLAKLTPDSWLRSLVQDRRKSRVQCHVQASLCAAMDSPMQQGDALVGGGGFRHRGQDLLA